MRRYLTGLLAVLLLLCTTAGAVDGAGKAEPLALSASSVADGAANVAADTSIRLDFTKNVVNLQVKDNNMTCFSVTDSGGNQVPIVVSMGDDQVDREVRNTIYVSPATAWPAGETLTLTISGNLMAKNGSTMGTAHTLRFTVAGAVATPAPSAAVVATPKPVVTTKPAATPEPTPAPTPAPTPVPAESEPLTSETPAIQSTPAVVETETPVPSPTPAPSEPPVQPDADGGIPAAVILAVVLIAAAAAAVLLVLRSRGDRK